MSGSLSLFIVSILGVLGIFFFNMYYGTPTFVERSDKAIIRWMRQGRTILRFVNKKTFGLLAHYLIERIERFFNRTFTSLKRKVKK